MLPLMNSTTKTALGWGRAGLLAAALAGLHPLAAQAQQPDSLARIRREFEKYTQRQPVEKVYLHLDRGLYASGELLWFKVYAVDGRQHQPLALTKVAYVEVLDARQQPILQAKIGLQGGTGHGSFQLPATLETGRYTVRAYTSWMKNGGPDYYFHCPVTVINSFAATQPAADTTTSYAVRFFPEGGHLVQGLAGTVGFKVTDGHGRGVAAEGEVLDARGRAVASFRTLKFGLGRFELTPAQLGAGYVAVVRVGGRPPLRQPLPEVQPQGYALHLADSGPALTLSVRAAQATNPETLYLLVHARHGVATARPIRLEAGQLQLRLLKAELPEGVVHFTVFDGRQQPVAERLYFQRPRQLLNVTARPDQIRYDSRSKVTLQVATGQPTATSLSVAVFRLDSLSRRPADISSTLWLTADLPGAVEQPDYYLYSPEAVAAEAADNLMLTHGWRRFRWDKLLAGQLPPPTYPSETNGHSISGQVLNRQTGAPVAGVTTFLASPDRRALLYNAISGDRGQVQFSVNDFTGPHRVVLQTDTRRDTSTYRLKLANPFSTEYAALLPAGAPLLPPSARPDLLRRHLQLQTQSAYFGRYNAPHPPRAADSTAFFGNPDESYWLDDFTRFKTMEEVVKEYVGGVQVRKRRGQYYYKAFDRYDKHPIQPVTVLLDGVPVFDVNQLLAMDPRTVQRVQAVRSSYVQGTVTHNALVSYTTYRGDLAGYQPGPAALVQEYEGLQWEREFYVPRYDTELEKQNRRPDLRHLLYWNPNVTTVAGRSAALEFFTGDEPGRYLVVVQGLSATGLSGSGSSSFEVQQPALSQRSSDR